MTDDRSGPTPRQQNAQNAIHELLSDLAPVIGPDDDGLAEWEPGERPEGATLWEHITVTCWVDPETKCSYYRVLPSAGMLNHHMAGLLRAGLAEVEAPPED